MMVPSLNIRRGLGHFFDRAKCILDRADRGRFDFRVANLNELPGDSVRFCSRLWFVQGPEVWCYLLGYHFKCVRNSGEQHQEFVYSDFRHGPLFYRRIVSSGG